MGFSFSSIFQYLFPKQQKRIIMFGLAGAGKTTILYKFKLNQLVHTIPTIGFNVETLDVKNFRLTIWDFVGSDSLRRKFTHYLQNSDAVVFVVDSTDYDGIQNAEMALTDLLWSGELKNAPILLLANKQDLPYALCPEKVAEMVKIDERKHNYHVQGTSAYSGIGLYEGLEHLHNMLSKKNP
ncbi:ADP-ribosylation factor 4-like [Episyrphus balteatus]|uniref:ADP-ribosylation factor 4-like n=1 Tax=Episyrphus balteatus TaxID=286459 RepID=UPI002486A4A4|nr:ADP-ribosylation factor 4-like [Episyrphus balteatus]